PRRAARLLHYQVDVVPGRDRVEGRDVDLSVRLEDDDGLVEEGQDRVSGVGGTNSIALLHEFVGERRGEGTRAVTDLHRALEDREVRARLHRSALRKEEPTRRRDEQDRRRDRTREDQRAPPGTCALGHGRQRGEWRGVRNVRLTQRVADLAKR